MFWRRSRPDADVSPSTPKREQREDHADAALDAVGSILRSFGEHALDLPDLPAADTARAFDRWARHLLIGAPHPLRPDSPVLERDWSGIRRYFEEHRKRETDYIASALSELRGLLWTFVERLAKSIPEESREDAATRERIDGLKRAVRKQNLEELRTEALEVASFLDEALKQRDQRRRAETERLAERIQSLHGQLEAARQDSETDPLTKLVNRRGFNARIERAVILGSLFKQQSSLLLFDLDHFKSINDRFGHPGGDAVLVAVAGRIARAFPRKIDCVARIGGEEFAVLLTESGLADGHRLAVRFLAELQRFDIDLGSEIIRVTASAGISELRAGETAAAWMARSDGALYSAKEAGRNRAATAD
jgi:diguanylate cyclase (GGDEF)-like protein